LVACDDLDRFLAALTAAKTKQAAAPPAAESPDRKRELARVDRELAAAEL
jgi:hypothetical protein